MTRQTPFIQHLDTCPKSPLGEGFMTCGFNKDIVNLGTAENRLLGPEILPLFQSQPELTPTSLTYQAAGNNLSLRSALADLYRDWFGIKEAQPDQFLFGCGISYLVEQLGLVLCEPGNVVLIPKPAYGAFEPDLIQSCATVVYIDLENLPAKPPEKSRLLILTNPGNPVGDLITDQDNAVK
jgi:histidinol-phosphate/aromatic aminotransferase/cobyric acid decarboxylase-like protein